MNNTTIHHAFVRELEQKIAKKSKLAEFIADTLCIEKETAYRRIRGDVQFSLREAVLIAEKLNISIDDLILNTNAKPQKNMIMLLPEHSPSQVASGYHIEKAIHFLENITAQPHSELGVALSGIPFSLFLPYKVLSRFFLLKHTHHAENASTTTSFEKIEEPQKMVEFRHSFNTLFHNISSTFYIWDRQIITTLVRDIQFAKSIRLIADEEIDSLKKELYQFLNDLEQLAAKGTYDDTGHKFELYISDAHIDVTYAYILSESKQVSMLSSFIFYMSASEDKLSLEKIKNWIKSLKRYSTLISGTGEKERILFFEEQRMILNTL
ncbi:hypothetical protein [Parabacteroides sp. PF5-9]|uniref:hypothetical protein n=1 Tax=Parabacteroides sp. PF5-9 TaxID=1742404 RepID=UPI0024752F93|nr:hypothetical protein [Parabacteroides sp. PF5-9]MDH6356611.1 hypothetical protein [Parabacteroides sp. PF5-9]